jgi:hypothetical protein
VKGSGCGLFKALFHHVPRGAEVNRKNIWIIIQISLCTLVGQSSRWLDAKHAETRRLVACLSLCICNTGRKVFVKLSFFIFYFLKCYLHNNFAVGLIWSEHFKSNTFL